MKSEAKRLVFILEVGALGLGLWKEFSQGSSSQQKEGNLCLKRVITPEAFSKRKENLNHMPAHRLLTRPRINFEVAYFCS